MISTSITNNSATIVITDATGKSTVYPLNRTHINYDAALDAVRNHDESAIHALCNVSKSIENFAEGNVRVENGHVYYGSLLLEGMVVDRILSFIKHKLPVQPLLRFINNLYENPSARAINELYKFLEHKNMPITPSGNFLAYNGVQIDYFSKSAGVIEVIKGKVVGGKIYNGIGEEIEVKRNQVCDDKDIGCSKGLHAGSVKSATDFSQYGKVVIVEINPADVVSIPTDCECQTLRVCAYKVVGEFEVPLNDNYCNTYSSCGIDDDGDGDSGCSNCDDEEDDLESDDDYYENAYHVGYIAGHDGEIYDSIYDGHIKLTNHQFNIWKDNYTNGYIAGKNDSSADQNEFEAVYDVGYACGYRDGHNYKSYGDSCEKNYETEIELKHYDQGYNQGYDAGVKNRK